MMVLLDIKSKVLNTARFGLGGAGTQTAALAFGGQTSYWYRSNRRI
jgi:hypothetical protein